MKLIIQIPCLNEAQTLEIALNDLPKHIDGIDEIEILIINDGSVDNTVEVARNWGVDHIVSFTKNKGLAKGFMAGIDACLRNGADIIVNTDADNQYCGEDIEKLVRPILEKKADIVIGERPIDDTEHFSPLKKKLQHFGSYVVRVASKTDIPDAPSGFRAFSREAAMHLNVMNNYTYTLETIVQAGRTSMAITSVTFFSILGLIPFILGLALAIRFLVYFFSGSGSGHIQSLVFSSTLMLLGFMTFVVGLQADCIANNRKLLEDIQYRIRRLDFKEDERERPEEKENGDREEDGTR